MSSDSNFRFPVANQDVGGIRMTTQTNPLADGTGAGITQEVVVAGYTDDSLHTLVQQLIVEVRDLKYALLTALG